MAMAIVMDAADGERMAVPALADGVTTNCSRDNARGAKTADLMEEQ